jgi:hypothetical protein
VGAAAAKRTSLVASRAMEFLAAASAAAGGGDEDARVTARAAAIRGELDAARHRAPSNGGGAPATVHENAEFHDNDSA